MCDKVANTTQRENQLINNLLDIPDILTIVVSIIGVFLNGLLFILCCGKRHLPETYVIFVRNLAMADFCTALSSIAWSFRRLIPSYKMQDIISLFSWVSVFVSFLTLLAIAVQRYIAVVHSLWSHSTMKNHTKLLKQISIAMWLVAISCGIAYYFEQTVTSFILTMVFEIIIIIIIVLYFKIYKSLRKYRVKEQQGIYADQRQLRLNVKKETKLTVVVFWITGVLIVGVLPYIIILQMSNSHFLHGNHQFLRCNKMFIRFGTYWVVVEMLAFALNPIIYARRFRLTCSRLKSDILSSSVYYVRRSIMDSIKRITPEDVGKCNVAVTSTNYVETNEIHALTVQIKSRATDTELKSSRKLN